MFKVALAAGVLISLSASGAFAQKSCRKSRVDVV